MSTPVPHKWAKEIKAWADGVAIEQRFRTLDDDDNFTGWTAWHPLGGILWQQCGEYRIKPEPRTWWFLESERGNLHSCTSEEEAHRLLNSGSNLWMKVHKYREPEA